MALSAPFWDVADFEADNNKRKLAEFQRKPFRYKIQLLLETHDQARLVFGRCSGPAYLEKTAVRGTRELVAKVVVI